jgi:hypothetical protein
MHPRLASILQTPALPSSVAGFETFDLNNLKFGEMPDFDPNLPLRMGHIAERAVAALIRASANYRVLEESLQVVVEKQTLGELDFILENLETGELIHLELAYKFYLYDPAISNEHLGNWIGPNRRDSLVEKLEKLRSKQFPLLHHTEVRHRLVPLEVEAISQKLCFLSNLYLPFGYAQKPETGFQKAIRGHYFNFETFVSLHRSENRYFIPRKTAWGIDPVKHEGPWYTLEEIQADLLLRIKEKRSPLLWMKQEEDFLEFFVVWW